MSNTHPCTSRIDPLKYWNKSCSLLYERVTTKAAFILLWPWSSNWVSMNKNVWSSYSKTVCNTVNSIHDELRIGIIKYMK